MIRFLERRPQWVSLVYRWLIYQEVTLKRYVQERRLFPVSLLVLLGVLVLLTGCGGGAPASSWFGVVADVDTVYLAANEQLLALDLENGTELWAFPPEPDKEIGSFYATPLLTQDEVIVGSFKNGKLYAVPQDGGGQKWAIDTGEKTSIVEGAVSADGGIVVGNNEGQVYLVGEQGRKERVLLETGKPIWAAPLVDEGRVYVPCLDHHLYAVDLESGAQLWDAFEANGAIAGTPALSDGTLYFGTLANAFYAIDAETGVEQWHVETQGWVWGGPLVHENTVYFGDLAGVLYALDATNGSERWTFEAEGGIRATPLLDGDSLYFGTRKKKVYAIEADGGSQSWMQSLDGAVYSRPVISGDYLLLSPHNTKVKLVALYPESGAERWSYPSQEE
jgi:outer membrane protein assembly factor BamB